MPTIFHAVFSHAGRREEEVNKYKDLKGNLGNAILKIIEVLS